MVTKLTTDKIGTDKENTMKCNKPILDTQNRDIASPRDATRLMSITSAHLLF